MTNQLSKPLPKVRFSASMRVGSRLQRFWKTWENLGALPSVVHTLRYGLSLDFLSRPVLSSVPLINSRYPDAQRNLLLKEAVEKMLAKGAIEPVQNTSSLGFYSRLFLVPKKSGGWRPVIDLSSLNNHLNIPSFKMETAEFIRENLQQGQWVTSLDLSDAYFHIPMAQWTHKYLRFMVLGVVYQFLCLPFGLGVAPREFTTVAKEVKRIAIRLLIWVFQYIDDWLNQAASRNQCAEATLKLLKLTQMLGWMVNLEKSELVPTQIFSFLGYMFDLLRGVVYPTEARFQNLLKELTPLLTCPSSTPRHVMRILGLMACMEKLVPQGRLHMRPLQLELKRLWHHRKSLDCKIIVAAPVINCLKWWLVRKNVMATVPLHPPKPSISIYTDASLQGWGAHMGEYTVQGTWTISESVLHINVLELKAVFKALKALAPKHPQHKVIRVVTDNTTVACYINKQGGTRSPQMVAVSWALLSWCKSKEINLQAQHLAGVMNVLADQLSRQKQILHTEWSLDQKVFDTLCLQLFKPQIDLFATRMNHKLPLFVSPVPDPLAIETDAMSKQVIWSRRDLYAFPPPILLPQIVAKLRASQNCQMLLVAPFWETKVYHGHLMQLSVVPPVELPKYPHLLKQPHLEVFHRNLQALNLHAFWLRTN